MNVDLALISHTNVGKTTLARTLLRSDVGEVLDRAHVTEESEVFELIADGEDRLLLWDTPGFGDSARLLKRLKAENNPLGWFLHQVWDRFADRPLWCSQQATRTLQEEADVVLYLVNAAEPPEDAGYAKPELELLSWIGLPVLILLNQRGDLAPTSPEARRLEETWSRHVEAWPVVRGVLSLDAFTRCWLEEGVLLRRVTELLSGEAARVMGRLAAAWKARNFKVFDGSLDIMGTYLAQAAAQRLALSGSRASRSEKAQAMTRLGEQLETETQQLMDTLIRQHGLEGRSTRALVKAVDDYLVAGTTGLTMEKGALLGGAVSGALGGLAADLMAGGLTFGGGLVAGAILGALGGAGLSRAHELVRLGSQPAISWSPTFLVELTRQTVLRYLAVAHFGRGRGEYEDREDPKHWQEAVASALETYRRDLERALKEAATEGGTGAEDLRWVLRRILVQVLRQAYPQAAEALEA
ncbi:MAG: DUF3482 domain-containing protein [Acidobacteria bacterium]|nr:DUF3482 domain-containing protein [Acidobacteriota bacterium]